MAEKKEGLLDKARDLLDGAKNLGKTALEGLKGFGNAGLSILQDWQNGLEMAKYKLMISRALNVLIKIAEKMMGILHQETEAATKAAEAAGKKSPTKAAEKSVGNAGKNIKEKAEQITDKVKANVKDAPGKEVKGMSGKEAPGDAAKTAVKAPGDAAKAAVKAPASAMKEAGSKGMAIVSGAPATAGKALAPAANKGNIPTR